MPIMKTKLYISLFFVAFSLAACKKTLDLNPLDQISSATFWQSKGDFDKALAAVYATMQSAEFSVEAPVRDWSFFVGRFAQTRRLLRIPDDPWP